MSFNQSRAERSDSSTQYRKSGRSGSSVQPRNFAAGSGKGGGGTAPPPSSTSTNSSLSSSRSYKKSNNAQGGQPRVSGVSVNSNPNYAATARTSQNGAHLQPATHGTIDAPVGGVTVRPTTDMSTQKSTQADPKLPASQPIAVNSDSTAPGTPAKASGDASKAFPLQFGSISPGFMNGMQIPARTNSAPPKLDEQQRDQVRYDSLRPVPVFPIPSVPKKQMPRKDEDAGDQSNTGEAYHASKAKRDAQVSSASPINQTLKSSVHHIPGISMPMPFHQPQVQFGVPNPQIQSQGMVAASLPMPIPMPLPLGNAPPLQQPLFVPGLQPLPMQPQGMMHQGQSMNFTSQMGPHLTPQLGNLGMTIGPQFSQHQTGKFSTHRKPVKITHPDTHEELRLGKRADNYMDGGSSGPRSHPNVPQSQPITSVPPAHPINYYSNSVYFTAPSSLTSTHLNPSSQAARISYPVSQSTQTTNPSAHTLTPSAPSASLPVTIKQATGLQVEKIADSSQVHSSSISSLPCRSSEHTDSFNSGDAETIATKTSASSSNRGGIVEPTRESLSTHSAAHTDAPELQTDSDEQGSICESSEMFGSKAIMNSLDTDHHARQNDSFPQDEPLKLETMVIEDQVGILLNEGPKQDQNNSETSSESVSLHSTELLNQTESYSGMKTATTSHEVQYLEIAHNDLEEPLGHCIKDDVVADNPVIPTSLATEDTNAKSFSTSNSDKRTSISDVSCSESDSLGSCQTVVTKSVLSDEVEAPVSTTPSVSEPTLKPEGEGTEDVNVDLVSLPAEGSKDKPVLELSRSKSNAVRGRKKIKKILQKADAAGTTSDLYMAYKGPEEKKETAASSEGMTGTSSINSDQLMIDTTESDAVLGEKVGQNKSEPDDWEDAADISTPKLETVDDGKQLHGGLRHHSEDGNGVMAKKYSRDFLLKFSEQFTDLPVCFEITSDIAEALMVSNLNTSRESHPSPGRIVDRPSGVSRPDRRVSGMGDDDKWNKLPGPLASGRDLRMDGYGGNFRPGQGVNYGVLRNPRVQIPPQHAGGILSGPMQSLGPQGGIQRNNSDSDRWQRATAFQKGLIPSPQTPSPVMHKAEKKYEVGKVTDEEVAKQRQLKAILNKLTPQNFEKLFEQVKAVNIDNAVTLTGVISQIFDKALMEPTFCEMYANFCVRLAGALPDFGEDNEKITFKRLLLNKCQEEFERGEREQQEADRDDEEGEVKQSEEEREEKRIRARRRMLGNIRLIGELYKKKMLTERIMHECIKKLLGQDQNPDEEDIEALCKLMSTIGEMIDQPRAKVHMDAYFDMMTKLSNNMKLSSRLRFMLKDSIDLRGNKWQQRRKIEGPKKIEEVHRDAAQERHVQAGRLARAPSMNSSVRNRQPTDFGPRGSAMLSSPTAQMGGFRRSPAQLRGYATQDARLEDRHSFENRIMSVPLPQRPIAEDSITLGPQGGLARGMSIRGQPSMPSISLAEAPSPGDFRRMPTGMNGYSSVSDRSVSGSREDLMPRYMADRSAGPSHDQLGMQDRNVNFGNRELRNADRGFDRSLPLSPTRHSQDQTCIQNIPSDKEFPEECLRDKSIAAIREFYSAKDEKEVALCIKELNTPSFYPTMISIWVSDSFERKAMERDLLAKLLVNLSKSQDGMLNGDHLIKGFESVLATLEDAVNDAPKAGEFLGRIFAKIILENVIPFTEIVQLVNDNDGGEEQGSLLEIGLAAEIVGTILETIESEQGESVLNEIRSSSSLKMEQFRPPVPKKSLRLDKFI